MNELQKVEYTKDPLLVTANDVSSLYIIISPERGYETARNFLQQNDHLSINHITMIEPLLEFA